MGGGRGTPGDEQYAGSASPTNLTRIVGSDGIPGVAKTKKVKGAKGTKKKKRASSKGPSGAAPESLTADGPPPVYFAEPGGFDVGEWRCASRACVGGSRCNRAVLHCIACICVSAACV